LVQVQLDYAKKPVEDRHFDIANGAKFDPPVIKGSRTSTRVAGTSPAKADESPRAKAQVGRRILFDRAHDEEAADFLADFFTMKNGLVDPETGFFKKYKNTTSEHWTVAQGREMTELQATVRKQAREIKELNKLIEDERIYDSVDPAQLQIQIDDLHRSLTVSQESLRIETERSASAVAAKVACQEMHSKEKEKVRVLTQQLQDKIKELHDLELRFAKIQATLETTNQFIGTSTTSKRAAGGPPAAPPSSYKKARPDSEALWSPEGTQLCHGFPSMSLHNDVEY
jgi:hypothetical protein